MESKAHIKNNVKKDKQTDSPKKQVKYQFEIIIEEYLYFNKIHFFTYTY